MADLMDEGVVGIGARHGVTVGAVVPVPGVAAGIGGIGIVAPGRGRGRCHGETQIRMLRGRFGEFREGQIGDTGIQAEDFPHHRLLLRVQGQEALAGLAAAIGAAIEGRIGREAVGQLARGPLPADEQGILILDPRGCGRDDSRHCTLPLPAPAPVPSPSWCQGGIRGWAIRGDHAARRWNYRFDIESKFRADRICWQPSHALAHSVATSLARPLATLPVTSSQSEIERGRPGSCARDAAH